MLQHGNLVERGTPAQVLAHPFDEYTRTLLEAAPVADPVEQRRRRELRLSHR